MANLAWSRFVCAVLTVAIFLTAGQDVLAQSCSATAPCGSCAGQSDWPCSCPSNMPSNATVSACCCDAPGCNGCTGCCTKWVISPLPPNPPVYGTSCLARGCLGGTSCTNFNCFGSGGGSGFLIADDAAEPESAEPMSVKTEGRSSRPLVGYFARVPDVALLLDSMVVHLGSSPNQIEKLSFTIRNDTGKAVTTVVLAHSFHSVAGENAVIYQALDLFAGRADILAGQAMPQLIDVNLELKAPLGSIRTEVTFLEFSDGSQFGTNREAAAQLFSELRARDRRVFANLSEILRDHRGSENFDKITTFLNGLPQAEQCSDAAAITRYLLQRGDLETLRRLSESPRIPQRRN